MKILFIARHSGYLRNFDTAIRALAAGGHDVRLALERQDHPSGSPDLIASMLATSPTVSVTTAPVRARHEGVERVRQLRLAIDYLRYREPAYLRTPHLRERAGMRAPESIVRLLDHPVWRRRPGRRAIGMALRWLEQAVPVSQPIADWLREEQPDLVLVTPLIELGSPQFDYLQAARSLGLRTALPFALIGVIVGEFLAASEGLGYRLNMYSTTYNTTGTMAMLFVMMALMMSLNSAMIRIERKLLRWKPRSAYEMQAGF